MKKPERSRYIEKILDRLYPHPKPFLTFQSSYQLMVAVILSAQCTDARVNMVTKKLFHDCPGPRDIDALGVKGLIPYIRSCGFFNTKAKHIIGATKVLLTQLHGRVPKDFEALQTLPGIGEKSAGVILNQAFGLPAFPVDTHVFRVSRRLGLSHSKQPNQVSHDLKKLFPVQRWGTLAMQFILHGRSLCMARKPKCGECPLLPICFFGRKRMPLKKSLALEKNFFRGIRF